MVIRSSWWRRVPASSNAERRCFACTTAAGKPCKSSRTSPPRRCTHRFHPPLTTTVCPNHHPRDPGVHPSDPVALRQRHRSGPSQAVDDRTRPLVLAILIVLQRKWMHLQDLQYPGNFQFKKSSKYFLNLFVMVAIGDQLYLLVQCHHDLSRIFILWTIKMCTMYV